MSSRIGKFGAVAVAVVMAASVAACDSGPSKDVAEQVAKLVSLEIGEIEKSKTADDVWEVRVKAKTETSAFGQKLAEENEDVVRLRKTSDGKFEVVE